MKKIDEIEYTLINTSDDFEMIDFNIIKDYLKLTFNDDYEAMKDCELDFYLEIDSFNKQVEQGNHPWAVVLKHVNKIVFDEDRWTYTDPDAPFVEIWT